MTHRFTALVLPLFMACVLIASAAPAYAEAVARPSADTDYKWEGGLFFSYLTGDYGQDRTSDLYYAAAMIKRYLGWGDVTLTVPYLAADGLTVIGGTAEPGSTAGNVSGLGDILLKGRWYAIEQQGLLPFIDLVGSIKFPTADADRGLGTGEPDFTILSEYAWRLGDGPWIALAELGYTFVGKPAGMDAKNRWLYSAGLAYEANPKLTLSGYLEGRTAIFEGNEDPLSVLLIGQYKLRLDLRCDTMFEIGLTDGSPDFGITLGFRKRL